MLIIFYGYIIKVIHKQNENKPINRYEEQFESRFGDGELFTV